MAAREFIFVRVTTDALTGKVLRLLYPAHRDARNGRQVEDDPHTQTSPAPAFFHIFLVVRLLFSSVKVWWVVECKRM